MPPRTTTWERDEHTVGKHLVLREYLNAWIPILGMSHPRVLIFDGFAGPGEYKDGSEGSPLIAMRAAREHHASGRIDATLHFRFVEAHAGRFDHLTALVDEWRPTLPQNCDVKTVRGSFDDVATGVLDKVDETKFPMPPSLFLIDPFGVSGIPLATIQRILSHAKTEVYITLMYDFISRFRKQPEFEGAMDGLFGTGDWRQGIAMTDPTVRREFFHGLYKQKLRDAGAEHVVSFDLYQGRRMVYSIFFGTRSLLGCDRMKAAIWKVAPWGDYAFRAGRAGQLTLGLRPESIDFSPLQAELTQRFGGQTVTIRRVQDFIRSDETGYTSSHLKRHALAPMEKDGRITVVSSKRKTRRGYPDGTTLRFATEPS
jgi:three-Cys-motif partner protein